MHPPCHSEARRFSRGHPGQEGRATQGHRAQEGRVPFQGAGHDLSHDLFEGVPNPSSVPPTEDPTWAGSVRARSAQRATTRSPAARIAGKRWRQPASEPLAHRIGRSANRPVPSSNPEARGSRSRRPRACSTLRASDRTRKVRRLLIPCYSWEHGARRSSSVGFSNAILGV